jgi:hypothetical protein
MADEKIDGGLKVSCWVLIGIEDCAERVVPFLDMEKERLWKGDGV